MTAKVNGTAKALTAVGDRPGADGGPGGAPIASAAADLLAHWWTRPVAEETATWLAAAHVEVAVRAAFPSAVNMGDLARRGTDGHLLDEYERLFVGPGPVPCPPYESFWREDVPIDIRRSLMGPCTADLGQLYGRLGLELAPASGEMPDHVAVELEAFAYALGTEEAVPVAVSLWSDHLRRWLPRLCRAVAHEAEVAFYRDLAELTLAWSTEFHYQLEALAGAGPEVG